jgi:hypothetical protein
MIAKRWIAQRQDMELVASLARALGTSQVLVSLLLARGCDDEQSAHVFLHPSYEQLYDRSLKAIDQSEPVLIYGDYELGLRDLPKTSQSGVTGCGNGAGMTAYVRSQLLDFGLRFLVLGPKGLDPRRFLVRLDDSLSTY